MPSRKKAKGKARRAAKEAKAAEVEVKETVAVTSYDGGSLETQMQRLTLTIDDLFTGKWRTTLGGLSKLLVDGLQCHHGLELLERRCEEFVEAFHDGYNACCDAGENDMGCCLNAGFAATKAEGKFADVWKSVAMLENIVSYCVARGTQFILDGHDDAFRLEAFLACPAAAPRRLLGGPSCSRAHAQRSRAAGHAEKAYFGLLRGLLGTSAHQL